MLGIDNSLTLLINLSGKLRMLSHRIVMLGLLDIQNNQDEPQIAMAKAVEEFEDIYKLLTKGDNGERVGHDTIEFMKQNDTIKDHNIQIVEEFLALVHARSRGEYDGDRGAHYRNMANMVGNELLTALNAINADISAALEARVQERQKKEKDSANMIAGVLENLNDTSRSISLVATNAMIEAARAGDTGKGFAIIASEIKNLSDKTSETVRSLRQNSTAR